MLFHQAGGRAQVGALEWVGIVPQNTAPNALRFIVVCVVPVEQREKGRGIDKVGHAILS